MPGGMLDLSGFYGGGGGGNLYGSVSGYNPAYGGIPNVPNPAGSASAAVGANMANISKLYELYGGLNTFMGNQSANQLKMNLPNYQGLINQRSDIIGQELAGMVPQDVVDQLVQRAAERGISTGSPGSPNANSAYLRALGLTSLDMTNRGQQGLSTAIHDTPTAPLSNPAQMFITPDAIQQAQMAANIYASAPNPAAAAAEARRWASMGGGSGGGGGGGWNSRSVPVSLPGGGGGTGPYRNPSPDYGPAIVAGFDEPGRSRYSGLDFSIPGVPMTTQFGGGSADQFSNYNSRNNPSGWNYYGATPGMGGDDGIDWNFWNNPSNFGDDGIDWDWWNDSSNFEPDSTYNPVLNDPSMFDANWSETGYDPFSYFDPGF